MPEYDERNILQIGAPARPGDAKITQAMAESVRQRIEDAGGTLTVWTVLREDRYESLYGDGFYIHVKGIALNSKDAHNLAELTGDSEWVRWHIKGYELGLENGQPAFLKSWPEEEEFRIGDFVEILSTIAPGQTASKLCTGTRWWRNGPFVSPPET